MTSGRISWSRGERAKQRRDPNAKRWLIAIGISGPGGEITALGATESEAFAEAVGALLTRFARGEDDAETTPQP